MPSSALRDYLIPGEPDDGFKKDLLDLAHLALRLLGLIQTAVPLVMLAAGIGVIPVKIDSLATAVPNLVIAAVGALTFAVGSLPASRPYARIFTAISVWLTPATLVTSVILLRPQLDWADHYLMGNVILVLFAAATFPFRPLQMLALGLAIVAFYFAAYIIAERSVAFPLDFGLRQHIFTFGVALASTALTAIIYRQRARNYERHQSALRTSEDLRKTQSRLLITENAASMGRLAAALSHELNSPIGVLASAVETLAAAASRNENTPARVKAVIDDTRHAGKESAQRLRSLVARMQRFTNLDRAEVQAVQVNDVIADVIALMDPETRSRANIDFRPAPLLPRFVGRPQQLSAVFSNIISNAVEAGSQVTIETRPVDSHIEVTVADNGPGMSPEVLAGAFNPATFKISGSRIAAGNWGLFNCRQIAQEHGGDIEIRTPAGGGTAVTVTLPF
jgi:signal transduction histidine kinase